MNKYKSLAMALAMAFAFSACGNTATVEKEETKEEVKQEEVREEESKKETSEEEKETENTTDLASLTGEYEGTAKGYGGDINVKVTLENGEITAIESEENETGAVGGQGLERIKD